MTSTWLYVAVSWMGSLAVHSKWFPQTQVQLEVPSQPATGSRGWRLTTDQARRWFLLPPPSPARLLAWWVCSWPEDSNLFLVCGPRFTIRVHRKLGLCWQAPWAGTQQTLYLLTVEKERLQKNPFKCFNAWVSNRRSYIVIIRFECITTVLKVIYI